MRDVASRAQVALGTIYRYFASKDHLLAECQLETWRTMEERIALRRAFGMAGSTPMRLDAVRRDLRSEIEAQGYFPDLVEDTVALALAGEDLIDWMANPEDRMMFGLGPLDMVLRGIGPGELCYVTGKASGAYMNGSAYYVHPYLHLNHNYDYESLSTFVHEWGQFGFSFDKAPSSASFRTPFSSVPPCLPHAKVPPRPSSRRSRR